MLCNLKRYPDCAQPNASKEPPEFPTWEVDVNEIRTISLLQGFLCLIISTAREVGRDGEVDDYQLMMDLLIMYGLNYNAMSMNWDHNRYRMSELQLREFFTKLVVECTKFINENLDHVF